MGRKTYDRRAGRPRPPGQRSDFTYVAEELARARRWRHTQPTPQTTGEHDRRPNESEPNR